MCFQMLTQSDRQTARNCRLIMPDHAFQQKDSLSGWLRFWQIWICTFSPFRISFKAHWLCLEEHYKLATTNYANEKSSGSRGGGGHLVESPLPSRAVLSTAGAVFAVLEVNWSLIFVSNTHSHSQTCRRFNLINLWWNWLLLLKIEKRLRSVSSLPVFAFVCVFSFVIAATFFINGPRSLPVVAN